MEQVIREMVPRRLQKEARNTIRPQEESVVEAIAHALVRSAEQEGSRPVPAAEAKSATIQPVGST
jgi:hypothetical protein